MTFDLFFKHITHAAIRDSGNHLNAISVSSAEMPWCMHSFLLAPEYNLNQLGGVQFQVNFIRDPQILIFRCSMAGIYCQLYQGPPEQPSCCPGPSPLATFF